MPPRQLLPDFEGLYPDLLRINKQMHSEASPVLYARNCFEFVYFDTLGKDVHDTNFLSGMEWLVGLESLSQCRLVGNAPPPSLSLVTLA